ncbi:MAG: hypothetical protein M1833_005929 [Piccolia ochrophora]|nr:MAG: hypothetical protein M1833_005929 [Piccolia ochrophora]
MSDGAAVPLITSSIATAEVEDEHESEPEATSTRSRSEERPSRSPGRFVWILTVSAGISGLLFGYDTGVISATLVSIGSDLSHRPLSTLDKSVITSCTSLFALIASPLTGVLADVVGRKKVLVVADVLFILGALWQAGSGSVGAIVIGRSIVGMAVGGASLVVPLYISELSPSQYRGRMVTVSILFITLGQVISYVIGYFLSLGLHGWRWMVGIGALPAGVQLLTLAFLPETPRWLVKVGRNSEARRVLQKVYGDNQEASSVVRKVLRDIEVEMIREEWPGISNSSSVISKWPKKNSLMYFSATIFALVGFDSPILTSLSVALTNFTFTLASMVLIDRIGRRRMLLYSLPIMIAALFLCAAAFANLPALASPSSSTSASTSSTKTKWPLLILFSLILYVASYALGLGNVPWQQSELFPLSVRSLGSGLSTATNWSANFIVGLTFLPMMDVVTPQWTFVVYGLVCLAGWGAVWRIYPEMSGLSLEEVGQLLGKGWGEAGGEARRARRATGR